MSMLSQQNLNTDPFHQALNPPTLLPLTLARLTFTKFSQNLLIASFPPNLKTHNRKLPAMLDQNPNNNGSVISESLTIQIFHIVNILRFKSLP
jgi:hypothetical protein